MLPILLCTVVHCAQCWPHLGWPSAGGLAPPWLAQCWLYNSHGRSSIPTSTLYLRASNQNYGAINPSTQKKIAIQICISYADNQKIFKEKSDIIIVMKVGTTYKIKNDPSSWRKYKLISIRCEMLFLMKLNQWVRVANRDI